MADDQLVAVYLYGPLADQFGAEHAFAIRTPAEAVRALSANHPEFRAAFLRYERYAILADGDWRDGPEAGLLPVSRELHLLPQLEGGTFIGAALVGYAIPAIAGTLAAEIIGAVLVTALLWGVSQLFFKPDEGTAESDKSNSYVFSGANNVALQGTAVPVIYGRMFAGSVVVSAGLSVGDQQIVHSAARLVHREDVFEPHMANNPDRIETPTIVLQNTGTDAAPRYRLGPEGWRCVGSVALLEEAEQRSVDLWVPEDAGLLYRWDYWRGYHRRQPGETGLMEPPS